MDREVVETINRLAPNPELLKSLRKFITGNGSEKRPTWFCWTMPSYQQAQSNIFPTCLPNIQLFELCFFLSRSFILVWELNFQAFLSSGTSRWNTNYKLHAQDKRLTTVQKQAVKIYLLEEDNVILVLKIFNSYNKAYFVFHIIKVHCTWIRMFFWFRCIMRR